jgi:hypothetical protein
MHAAKIIKQGRFSKRSLSLFILAFGIIGYLIFRALAAPNPNLPGDLNNDNTVNITDLSMLLSNYGTTNTAADINNDGTVNVLDMSILLSNYNKTYIPTSGGAWAWNAKTATVDPNSATKLSASHISGFGSSSYLQATVARADTVSSTAGYAMSPINGTDSSVYIPLGSQAGSNSDRHLWVYDKVHGRETDLWLATYDSTTRKISKISGGVSMPIDAVTEPVTGSSTAARMPLGRGLITPADVASGVIAHPLVFSIPSVDIATSPTSIYPANTAYGGTGSGGLSFGSWVRLNSTVNCSGLGMPKLETMVCVALQNYGMFLRDIGSNMSIYGQDTINQGGYADWTNVGVTLPLVNPANNRHYAQQLSTSFPWGSMQLLNHP